MMQHLNVKYIGGKVKLTSTRAPYDYNTRRRFGRRLAALHRYLSTIPSSHYNHSSLAESYDKANPCGSVACAFGHAVVSGKFPNILAKFKVDSYKNFDGDTEVDITFSTKNAPKIYRSLRDVLGSVEKLNVAYAHSTYNSALSVRDITDDVEFSADEYFGPGAWATIFNGDSYGNAWQVKVTKAVVLKRIAKVAKNCYGVDVTASR